MHGVLEQYDLCLYFFLMGMLFVLVCHYETTATDSQVKKEHVWD